MKTIPLTQNQFAIVNEGYWFNYLNQWKWHAVWEEGTQSYYAARSENGKTILMHRVVANTPDGMVCDHIHHNTLDNRENELRNVTHIQSNMNTRIYKNNKLGVKGIFKRADSGSYRAELRFEGKKVLNKTFPTLDEAVSARKEAEVKYFGEFAYQEAS